VGPFEEAEAALARREAFDAQAWEAALAQKTALAPAPEPQAPELDEAMRRLRRARAILVSDDDRRVEASVRPADNPRSCASPRVGLVGARSRDGL
jgi:hypothetical protein